VETEASRRGDPDPPDLSLVIEMDTKEITGGGYDHRAALRAWIRQADALAGRRCEILVSSPVADPGLASLSTRRTRVRTVVTPGASYYGLKNAGARASVGRIVVFSDSDCRPGEGYLEAVVATFEDPAVLCAAGPTSYDGEGLLARINTTTSFGYLFQGEPVLERLPALSHNVAVRREALGREPFGPFNGRTRGDAFLTDACRRRAPIPIVPRMRIYHEDSAKSLRGLLDRQLREIFSVAGRMGGSGGPGGSDGSAGFDGLDPSAGSIAPETPEPSLALAARVLRAALKRPRRQLRLIRLYGPALGVERRHAPIVLVVLAAHALVNVAATAALLAVPRWTRRWLAYQFGVPRAPVAAPDGESALA